jgi:hypothetical protein
MSKTRLFNVLVAVVLILVLALTVNEAFATAGSVSGSAQGAESPACPALTRHPVARARYVKEMGGWLPYSENGPTGVDGGLIYILSNCSR